MWSLSVEYQEYYKDTKRDSETGFNEVTFVRQQQKIKQPILKPPGPLERVFGKDTGKPHYFTAGVNINDTNKRDVLQEPSPFKYPEDLEEFSYRVLTKAWRNTLRKKEAKYKYNERQSHRTRQQTDILNRLYVKEPDVASMRTILNLDPNFFKIVDGRPCQIKFDRREYIQNVRDVLRTRIVIGYREDDILLLEENYILEQNAIAEIKEEFQRYVNTFEDFLLSDHTNSMFLLRQSEELAVISNEKYEQYRELLKNFGSLKSMVYNLEEKWRKCKMYQKFLYIISPMEWRKQYDFYLKNQGDPDALGTIADEGSTTSIFGRFRLAGEVLTLEDLIDQFIDDVNEQEDPVLFFENPAQLLKVFTFIELQNLNSLLHSEELALPLQNVMDAMQKAQIKFDMEISNLQESVDSLEGGIIWEEQRAKYLEELALELINGDFRELIANEEVINLYAFVEDVFESQLAANDFSLTVNYMMRLIENTYRSYLLQLDRLPSISVYHAEMQCYAEEARIMSVAKLAAKKLVQIERLMKHLSRLLEPPVHRMQKELKWRSPPADIIKKPPPPPKPLTQDELDRLTFFVDFCDHIDNPSDFGIRVHDTTQKRCNEHDKGLSSQPNLES